MALSLENTSRKLNSAQCELEKMLKIVEMHREKMAAKDNIVVNNAVEDISELTSDLEPAATGTGCDEISVYSKYAFSTSTSLVGTATKASSTSAISPALVSHDSLMDQDKTVESKKRGVEMTRLAETEALHWQRVNTVSVTEENKQHSIHLD